MHILVSLFFLAIAFAEDSVVQTTYGPVQGFALPSHRAYLGIPFGSPPVGSLRFQPPRPPQNWTTTRKATQFSPSCPQVCTTPYPTCPPVHSEDCLYLNVYAPPLSQQSQGPFSVMVFLYGGNNQEGGGGWNNSLYDGSWFVGNNSVILVTPNYRLGALGWMATATSAYGSIKGNMGFLDQVLALQWVKNNIHQFGGNPNSVTLVGQSAGATGIRGHLISPGSKNLFHRAIMQSDPFVVPFKTLDDADSVANYFINELGCKNKGHQCLLNASIKDILAAQTKTGKGYRRITKPAENFYPWIQVMDGHLVPMQPLAAFEQGKYNKVPLLLGYMKDDALLFIWEGYPKLMNIVQYDLLLADFFHFQSFKVGQKYLGTILHDNRPITSVLGTDFFFHCIGRHIISKMKHWAPSVPIYYYHYEHVLSFDLNIIPACKGKVCHAYDLALEFNSPVSANFHPSANEKLLTKEYGKYWSNFAKTGNPNLGQNTTFPWPAWELSTKRSLAIDWPLRSTFGWMNGTCSWWDSVGYNWGNN